MRRLLPLILAIGVAAPATAQITVPNTLTAGTTILSSSLNTNFTTLGNNALNRTGGTMTGTLTTQNVAAGVDATYDIGASGVKFRNGYLSGTLTVGTVSGTTGTFSGTVTAGTFSGSLAASSLTGTLAYGALPTGGGTWTMGGNLTLSGGHLLFSADNTFDIGASGATRPRDLYLARNFIGKAEFDAGNTGAAITINFTTNGVLQKATRTANTTITLSAPAGPGTVVLRLVHDGTANTYTVAFSPTPKYPNGTAPTYTNTASAIDIVTLYWDGTTWYAFQQPNLS